MKDGFRLGADSVFGEVFQACRDEKCKYVLKCLELKPDQSMSDFYNEVRMQEVCASKGLCMPVEDSWGCDDKKGGSIITELLDVTLLEYLESTDDIGKKWEMIWKALTSIFKLHNEAFIAHLDDHLNNFMLSEDHKLMFIDMGTARFFR